MAMGLCPSLATIVGAQSHLHLGRQSCFVVMPALAALLRVGARC